MFIIFKSNNDIADNSELFTNRNIKIAIDAGIR